MSKTQSKEENTENPRVMRGVSIRVSIDMNWEFRHLISLYGLEYRCKITITDVLHYALLNVNYEDLLDYRRDPDINLRHVLREVTIGWVASPEEREKLKELQRALHCKGSDVRYYLIYDILQKERSGQSVIKRYIESISRTAEPSSNRMLFDSIRNSGRREV